MLASRPPAAHTPSSTMAIASNKKIIVRILLPTCCRDHLVDPFSGKVRSSWRHPDCELLLSVEIESPRHPDRPCEPAHPCDTRSGQPDGTSGPLVKKIIDPQHPTHYSHSHYIYDPLRCRSTTRARERVSRRSRHGLGARVASWTRQSVIHGTQHATRAATTSPTHVGVDPQCPSFAFQIHHECRRALRMRATSLRFPPRVRHPKRRRPRRHRAARRVREEYHRARLRR